MKTKDAKLKWIIPLEIVKSLNGLIKCPGKITVSFLEPIKPGLNRDEFIKNLEMKIYEEIKNIS